jgi:hypothetical protein
MLISESELRELIKESIREALITEYGDTEPGQYNLGRVFGRTKNAPKIKSQALRMKNSKPWDWNGAFEKGFDAQFDHDHTFPNSQDRRDAKDRIQREYGSLK